MTPDLPFPRFRLKNRRNRGHELFPPFMEKRLSYQKTKKHRFQFLNLAANRTDQLPHCTPFRFMVKNLTEPNTEAFFVPIFNRELYHTKITCVFRFFFLNANRTLLKNVQVEVWVGY